MRAFIFQLPSARNGIRISIALYALALLAGCGNNMRDQARCKPGGATTFFADGKCMQNPPENTVAHVANRSEAGGEAVSERPNQDEGIPSPLTAAYLRRGESNYNVYCAPCHGMTGDGNGMIVQRGFPAPPSFHTQRLRDASPEYYYDVITNGFGRMYPYAYRVEPADRWTIIAYVRALQLSQNATIDDVPPEQRPQIQGAAPSQQGGAKP